MAAFQQVYEEYGKPVYRFLLSLTGDESLAEELLQETFYQALQHIDRFEGKCSLYTWLCRIGKNAWLKECGRRKRYSGTDIDTLELTDTAQSPEERMIAQDDYRRIRQAVYRLEEPYKDVFIMHTFGGVKLREIAQIYGRSESWARVTYFRAKQKIVQEVLG